MAIEIRYEPKKGFIVLVVKGQLSHEEYKTAMVEITQSDQYPADINALWDVRDQDFENVDYSTVKKIVEISRQYPERGTAQVAFIVKDDLAYGMLRMFEMVSDVETDDSPQDHMVFRSYTDGEKWLLNEKE